MEESEVRLCDPNKANPPPEEENLPLQDGNHDKWGKYAAQWVF